MPISCFSRRKVIRVAGGARSGRKVSWSADRAAPSRRRLQLHDIEWVVVWDGRSGLLPVCPRLSGAMPCRPRRREADTGLPAAGIPLATHEQESATASASDGPARPGRGRRAQSHPFGDLAKRSVVSNTTSTVGRLGEFDVRAPHLLRSGVIFTPRGRAEPAHFTNDDSHT